MIMDGKILSGDICRSTCGRDKDGVFLVISVTGDRALIADGNVRKDRSLKKKNLKHLEILIPQADVTLSERIGKGIPTSDKSLRRRIAELSQKK